MASSRARQEPFPPQSRLPKNEPETKKRVFPPDHLRLYGWRGMSYEVCRGQLLRTAESVDPSQARLESI